MGNNTDEKQNVSKAPKKTQFKKGNKVGRHWKKGVSGNPLGRPPTFEGIVQRLRKGVLPVRLQNDPEKAKLYKDIIAEDPRDVAVRNVMIASYQGEPWAIKTVLEHTISKPIDPNLTNLPNVNVIVVIPDNGRRNANLLKRPAIDVDSIEVDDEI